MKKYMIVPFEEPKIPTHEQKINSILKNKNINRENKLKLINHILINNKKKNVQIFSKTNSDIENETYDQIDYEPQVNESNNQQFYEEQEQEPLQISTETQETEPALEQTQQFNSEQSFPPSLFTRNQFTLDNTPWRKTPRQQRSKPISKDLISQGPQKRKLNREDLVEEEPRKKQTKIDIINKEKKKSAQVLLKKAIETLTTPKPIPRVKKNLKVKKTKDKEDKKQTFQKPAVNKTLIKKTQQNEDISMIDVGQDGKGWQKY